MTDITTLLYEAVKEESQKQSIPMEMMLLLSPEYRVKVRGEIAYIVDRDGNIMSNSDVMSVLDKLTNFYSVTDDDSIQAYNALIKELAAGNTAPISILTSKPSMTAGYVYLVKADNGLSKIGKTAQIESRLANFKTLPTEIETVAVIKTQDMSALEKELHARFKSKRIRGEWFNLSDEDIAYIKSLEGQL